MSKDNSPDLFPGPRPARTRDKPATPRVARTAPKSAGSGSESKSSASRSARAKSRSTSPTSRSSGGARWYRNKWVRRIANWTAVAAVWGFIAVGALVVWLALGLPDVSSVAQFQRRASVTVLAADGNEFARFGDLHGTTLSVDDLPPEMVNAVLAIEDRRFFSHLGVDPVGLARAAYTNWRSGRTVQGGSTLTQQLAKNLFLTPERSLKRKAQEALLALWLEYRFSKKEILTAYLNRVYLGAGTFGVDAAARTYFGKPATRLTLRESATIAGLLKAPSRYAPSANPNEAADRSRVVLGAMATAGFITREQAAAAAAEPNPQRQRSAGDGRYFADWITDLVPSFLGRDHGDVVVLTTLDLDLQRAAEQRMAEMLNGPAAAARARQGALVAMTRDGAVRALVGGRDFSESEFNRATQAMRQPGSAFKPFVFLAALQAGWTPDRQVADAPVRVGDWKPGNYDGKYRGTITMAQALAYSSNTATVRIIDKVGVEPVRRIARTLGILSPMVKDLSLGLGTSEVSLLELTSAYAGIAARGASVWPYAITEIRDRNGTVLYRRQGGAGGAAIQPTHAVQLTRMMADVLDYGTGKAARLNRPAAGKTGTTQDYRDAWFIGFTADLVAGVWLGNDNNSPMDKVTGGTLPARLWQAFMTDAHAGRPVRALPGVEGAPAYDGGAAVSQARPAVPASEQGGIGALIDALAGGEPPEGGYHYKDRD